MAFKMNGFSAFTKTPMYKADPPDTQKKIIKMIKSDIENNKSDKDILANINNMSSGNVNYEYNRKTKEVKVVDNPDKTDGMGFEDEGETDPDKG
tara:strand:+ start:365 stop:646 length:282 start_codon:yes stop_codon:yes gene_type:complete